MAYGLPTRGQHDYDDELNNSVEAVYSTAQDAKAQADSARSDAAYAKNLVDSIGLADITSAVDTAESAATDASSSATSASGAASSAQSYATVASNERVAAEAARDAAEAAQAAAEAVPTTSDTIIAGRVNDSASATAAALSATFATVFAPERYGACPGDSTDVTAYVNAAITAAQAVGGTVSLQPGKKYRCNGAVVIPYTGTTNPLAKPVRITTPGAATSNGRWISNPLNGGATLDLRYDGTDGLHPAKIDTRGAGMLEIDHINLISGGTDDFPIFQTTYTAVHAHHNFVQGNTAKTGTACVQDAFILGGTSTTLGDGANAPFQGYGSTIHDNFFDHIRRGVVGRAYCNSIPVERNTFSTSCGNDGVTGTATLGAAIEFTGNVTAGYCVGNSTRANTIEVTNYKHGVAGDYAANSSFGPDSFWDPSGGGPYVAAVYFTSTCQYNSVQDGYHNQSYPLCLDDSRTATVRTSAQSRPSTYMQPKIQRGSLVHPNNLATAPIAMTRTGDQSTWRTGAGAATSPTYPEMVLQTAPARLVTDLATTSGSKIVTSATAAWVREDQEMNLKATGIPNDAYIVRYISATSVQLSHAATATATGVTAQFGRLGTAPTDEIGVARRHIISKGAIGSLAPNANAGTGATGSVAGTDTAFTVTLNTGSGSMGIGNLFSVGAGVSWSAAAKVVLTPKNAAAANAVANNDIYCTNTTANFFLACGVALPVNTTLIFDVLMIQ